MDHNPNPSKADRKTIEKNRRNQMKTLCSRLSSLVPHQTPREVASLPDQLEGATNYIKKLQTNIEKMKQKKNCLVGLSSATANSSARSSCSNSGGLVLPNVDVRVVGSALEVALVTGLNSQFMFTQTLRLLHEEGAEVLNASFSVLENSIFHTIHCQIGEPAQGYGAARISERLRKYVYDVN
ncbi:transcription factor bHLH125 [Sesamum indicum]|uniref:Transcription factor bHLH125 n=1 Tax=Sesamum indicum TaxID=4182 RepID=A0A6I9UEE6_SESIN|nr:transcription factor bHLH125 [Sesamum indicum]